MGLKAVIQVEHDMDIVFGYSDRIVALHQGRVLADATPAAIRADERVVDMVIGRSHHLPSDGGEGHHPSTLAPEGGEGRVRGNR
jgi:ABC-type hemin transport system ATPase subunit